MTPCLPKFHLFALLTLTVAVFPVTAVQAQVGPSLVDSAQDPVDAAQAQFQDALHAHGIAGAASDEAALYVIAIQGVATAIAAAQGDPQNAATVLRAGLNDGLNGVAAFLATHEFTIPAPPMAEASTAGTCRAFQGHRPIPAACSIVGIAFQSVTGQWTLLFGMFFTKLGKEEALEHPRRKVIFEYIRQHPGANFREVARNTGIASGTVRHHLNVLERSGQIVEHPHGSTVRLFENHGKFNDNWSDVVLLREPALGVVHAWLKANPASPQKAVLEAMEAHGWSRSTTQHRLARLVNGGLATIRLQGRLKIYSTAIQPMPAPPSGLSTSVAPPKTA